MTQTQKQNVPKLRFPEFEGDWPKRKLGELGPVSMCKRVMKDETKPSGDVPFYKIGTFGREPDAFIDRELFDRYLERYPFPKTGDVLISAAGTIGRLVVYDGSPAYFQDSNIVWVANDERDVSNKFLLFCYQNTRWTTEDTTIARLYNDNLRNIDISAPTLPEQRKIASFLSAVDEKNTHLSRKKALLEDYKKGCMQQLFSQKIRFKDDDGNNFPEWEEKRLGEVAKIQTGKKDVNEGNPNGVFPFFTCAKQHTYSDSYSFDTDAILIAGNGEVGHCLRYSGKFEAYQRTYVLSDFKTSYDFIYVYMSNKFTDHVLSQKQMGAMPYIKLSALKDFPIPFPHPDEQRKIADFLSALDHKIGLVSGELDHAQTFKQGLLQQMFV